MHPDKLKDPTPSQLALAQSHYIHLKNARDTLVDSNRRFAYDRFGPDMLEWTKCITRYEFVKHGLQQLLPYYIVTYST
jgi:DnaJ-class molecular chaperone